ncbi:MAG TPA: hypothetical protein VFW80_00090 [Gaiellaceae bacterium]|nr:hypothetical protein [Gaiellaceae bacterium]
MDTDLPALGRVDFPGPFSQHDVVVDGWRVPFLHAQIAGEDKVLLVLDRRLGVEITAAEAERVVPFIADAIAVALGYGAHPGEDTPRPLERAPYPRPERVVSVNLGSA